MATQIGLISDVHATTAPLQEALDIFTRHGVCDVLCAGDIAGYGDELDATIEILRSVKCHTICGNHDLWCLEKDDSTLLASTRQYLQSLPACWTHQVGATRIDIVHARPRTENMGGMHLLDEEGQVIPQQLEQWTEYLLDFDYDILIVGHTHQVFAETMGRTLVINPGSTLFNHSCAILTLPDRNVDFFALSGKQLLKSWNWGAFLAGNYLED